MHFNCSANLNKIRQKTYLFLMKQKRGLLSEFSILLSEAYARWKGTGELCPNFLWNFSKISPDRFEKFYDFCYPNMAPIHMVYEF